MDGLSAISLFLAAVEEGSFTAAGRRLGLSPSAAGKAIARLEARLGTSLFHRTTRSVRLTPEGEILWARAHGIRDQWRDIEAELSARRSEPSGRLRVGLPASGHRLLGPHLLDFAERFPNITLDLELDDRLTDLTTAGVDIAIRSGVLDDSSYRVRKLGEFRFVLVAAPGYLSRHGEPTTAAALSGHALIRFRYPGSDHLQPWRHADQQLVDQRSAAFCCTNMEGVLTAAHAGLGIAQTPDFMVSDDLKAGRLKQVLEHMTDTGQFWLIWPATSYEAPRVRAFIDFLVDAHERRRLLGPWNRGA